MSLKDTSRIRGSLGRGDLFAALETGDPEVVDFVAFSLGLELAAPKKFTHGHPISTTPTQTASSPPANEIAEEPNQNQDLVLWLPDHYVKHEQNSAETPPESNQDVRHEWRFASEGREPPTPRIVTAWNRIGPRLRRNLNQSARGRHPEIAKLVRRFARRELTTKIPRKSQRRWGSGLCVIQDTSDRLSFFCNDQTMVIDQLRSFVPEGNFTEAFGTIPWKLWTAVEDDCIPFVPPASSHVLVLSDLGCMSNDQDLFTNWQRWATRMRERGCLLQALVPLAPTNIPDELQQLFRIQTWQAPSWAIRDQNFRQDLVDQLLVLASPTLRLEPGLLRDLRLVLPGATDASLEIDVYNSDAISGRHPDAMTVDRRLSKAELLPRFDGLPTDLRRQALDRIRHWRLHLHSSPEIWFLEILSLSPESQQLVPEQDLQDARASVRHLHQETESGSTRGERVENWMRHATELVSDDAMADADVGLLLRKMYRTTHHLPGVDLPGSELVELATGDQILLGVHANDRGLVIDCSARGVGRKPLRPAYEIRATANVIEIEIQEQFWKDNRVPDFASDYGRDQYGAWFEFQVPAKQAGDFVTQRMRWIPGGTFMMGSPESEAERGSDEALHEVTLSGYWLADTTCTQAMWTAAMEKNPSEFPGADRPVERVSHDDALEFCRQINAAVPGLNLELPTEAQWEFACRAGSTSPFSTGQQITTQQANYDGNYPYANGKPSEYREHTVPVKSLPANPWGLYQMHGNVWEWCQDWYGDYETAPTRNPTGPRNGSSRAIRGGGWINVARLVRSPYRSNGRPGDRSGSLGFRCVSSARAEPVEGAEVPVAEQGSERTRTGGAGRIFRKSISDVAEQPAEIQVNQVAAMTIRTDREEVSLARTPKPSWAANWGRDRFGVFADVEISATKQVVKSLLRRTRDFILRSSPSDEPNVIQRMRWIPPGQFLMGSPPDEDGRVENEVQHHVTLTRGYWMFDTPCTQALWLAVMGDENPSRFPDPRRPVEQVTWEQASDFATKLAERVPELEFRLPTEAEWEYACRAGTETAIFTGPLEIQGSADAPALDPIAWYCGNSGHEFDLDDGLDISNHDWFRGGAYEFQYAGTRCVAEKHANPWGLYDMLGNAWEWCNDRYGNYSSEPATDPMGSADGSDRVIRGGCWNSNARNVRSASRAYGRPGDRFNFLGFRCVSSAGQASLPSK